MLLFNDDEVFIYRYNSNCTIRVGKEGGRLYNGCYLASLNARLSVLQRYSENIIWFHWKVTT